MIELPAIRWGMPYQSPDIDDAKHFYTGELDAKVHYVGVFSKLQGGTTAGVGLLAADTRG